MLKKVDGSARERLLATQHHFPFDPKKGILRVGSPDNSCATCVRVSGGAGGVCVC